MGKLTDAERTHLSVSLRSKPIPGLLTPHAVGSGVGFRRHAWERMMKKLEADGLVTPYAHGGYEITPAGRSALNQSQGGGDNG